MLRNVAVCLIVVGFAVAAFAQSEETEGQAAPEAAPKGVHQLGLGVSVVDSPYKGIGSEIYIIPLYSYTSGELKIEWVNASYALAAEDNWVINVRAALRREGYDSSDTKRLKGMSDRDISLDAGLGFILHGGWGMVSTQVVTDVLGKHKGQEITATYTFPLPSAFGIEGLHLAPFASLAWRSENLNDYYYGVRKREAKAGRPAYDADDCVNPIIGLAATYRLTDRWTIVGMLKNEWLGSEITDSPIVGQDHMASVFAGLTYRF